MLVLEYIFNNITGMMTFTFIKNKFKHKFLLWLLRIYLKYTYFEENLFLHTVFYIGTFMYILSNFVRNHHAKVETLKTSFCRNLL